jgi:general secretion pathway protein H
MNSCFFKHRLAPARAGKTGLVGDGGYTLLELVVVMALLALLMGLVLPGLMRTAKKEGVRSNLRQLTTILRLARSQAATSHRRVRVFLNKENGRYWLEGSNRQGDLAGMRLGDTRLVWEGVDRRQGYIAFYSDGTSSGGKLVMTDPTGRVYSLDVEIITGKVTLKSVEEQT